MLEKDIETYMNKNCYTLDSETILKMSKWPNDCAINNVVTGLNTNCWGIFLKEDGLDENYSIYYINGQKELSGLICKLNIHEKQRNEITFAFSALIAEEYADSTDPFETFNALQHHTRSIMEKLNYFTFVDEVPKGASMMLKGKKGAFYVPLMNRLKAIKEILGITECFPFETENRDNWIYLMFNPRNSQTKIGHSIRPDTRERTLQAEDPNIEILAAWIAPRRTEKELHKKFASKRTRGEWFDLSINDIVEIHKSMEKFPSSNERMTKGA